jgi:hypothetical protein
VAKANISKFRLPPAKLLRFNSSGKSIEAVHSPDYTYLLKYFHRYFLDTCDEKALFCLAYVHREMERRGVRIPLRDESLAIPAPAPPSHKWMHPQV